MKRTAPHKRLSTRTALAPALCIAVGALCLAVIGDDVRIGRRRAGRAGDPTSATSSSPSYQRWGIPVAAEPRGYRVYFKPGWLGAWILASQAARLERRRVIIGLAVFTDRNPWSRPTAKRPSPASPPGLLRR